MKCCVVTPVGPGHESRYIDCKNSVLSAFRSNPGPFTDLVFAAMDDRQGQHGRSQRRNDGIDSAIAQEADWIFFLDADDLMTGPAFAAFDGLHETHDAVWGAILEQAPGKRPAIRPQQAMPIHSLCTLLDHDPTLTVQMGHFVRSEVASRVRFDATMDTGEDYRYYLQLWRDYRCIKLDTPLFLNRRGIHSTGPRSASGSAWTEAVASELVAFRIDNSDEIARRCDSDSHEKHGRHILLSGFSRSGSTMFYNMLYSSVTNFDFLDSEYPAAHIIGSDSRNLVTKRPLDIFNIPQILAANTLDKTIDFIILLRDIRSILTSVHTSVPDDYFIGYDYQYYIPPEGTPTRTIPGIIPTYRAVLNLLRGGLPGKKIIIRYEDLIMNTTRIQEYLAQELRLRYRDRFDNFHQAEIPKMLTAPLNMIDAPDKSRISKWRLPEHRERIRSQFSQCPELFDILVQTGYEKNRSWFDNLE